MLQYREATIADIEQITFLHADSWRRHYKGIWSNEFLDNAVYQDRLDIWRNRLQSPAQNQYTLLAIMENKLQGFACIYTDDDPVFGS